MSVPARPSPYPMSPPGLNLNLAPSDSPALTFPPPPSESFSKSPILESKNEVAGTTQRRRRNFAMPKWSTLETFFEAAVPFLIGLAALVLSIEILWQQSLPLLTARQIGGSGLFEVYVLGSCAIAPGSKERICTTRSISADFIPSLNLISPGVPGYAVLKLPIHSVQSQIVFLAAFISMALSFVIFVPMWSLAYFPEARILPKRIIDFLRYYPYYVYFTSGIFSFVAMVLTFTVGLGYKLLLTGYSDQFQLWLRNALFLGGNLPGTTNWESGTGGDGWLFMWMATFLMACFTIGINVTLHNGIDGQIERYEGPSTQPKRSNNYNDF